MCTPAAEQVRYPYHAIQEFSIGISKLLGVIKIGEYFFMQIAYGPRTHAQVLCKSAGMLFMHFFIVFGFFPVLAIPYVDEPLFKVVRPAQGREVFVPLVKCRI